MSSFYLPTGQGYVLRLLVVPGASRTEVVGLHGDRLKLRVAAPRKKGRPTGSCLISWPNAWGSPRKPCALAAAPRAGKSRWKCLDLSPDLAARLQDLLPHERLPKLDKPLADDQH